MNYDSLYDLIQLLHIFMKTSQYKQQCGYKILCHPKRNTSIFHDLITHCGEFWLCLFQRSLTEMLALERCLIIINQLPFWDNKCARNALKSHDH